MMPALSNTTDLTAQDLMISGVGKELAVIGSEQTGLSQIDTVLPPPIPDLSCSTQSDDGACNQI
jgi:hypothetical protein